MIENTVNRTLEQSIQYVTTPDVAKRYEPLREKLRPLYQLPDSEQLARVIDPLVPLYFRRIRPDRSYDLQESEVVDTIIRTQVMLDSLSETPVSPYEKNRKLRIRRLEIINQLYIKRAKSMGIVL